GLRVVAEPAEDQVEEPVTLVLPGAGFVRAIGEDPPLARQIAEALVGQRGEDLEALAVSEPAALGEAGGVIGVAPQQQPLRADRPELIDDAVLPRLREQRAETVAAVAGQAGGPRPVGAEGATGRPRQCRG